MERDLIDGVVLLPDNLFYNTSAAGIIVVLSKAQAGGAQGQDRAGQRQPSGGQGTAQELPPGGGHPPHRGDAFLKGEPVEGEVAVITREQAAEADYNLSPSRWVGQAASGDGS